MRLAVLDLGSNSFQLAIYQAPDGRRLRRPRVPQLVERHREMVRLGAGMSSDGRIERAAWRRADEAIAGLVRRARRRTDHIVAVATSAIREARNGAELCAHVRARHGVAVEVLSGSDEARLGYRGACLGLPEVAGARAVIDLGGGSAQLTVGDGRGCRVVASLPIGVLRLRHLADAALLARVVETARAATRAIRALRRQELLVCGGTARRLGRLAGALGLDGETGGVLGRATLVAMAAALRHLDGEDLSALGVEEGRHDTIRPGALILDALLAGIGADAATIAPGGLREGVALRELADGRRRAGLLRATG